MVLKNWFSRFQGIPPVPNWFLKKYFHVLSRAKYASLKYTIFTWPLVLKLSEITRDKSPSRATNPIRHLSENNSDLEMSWFKTLECFQIEHSLVMFIFENWLDERVSKSFDSKFSSFWSDNDSCVTNWPRLSDEDSKIVENSFRFIQIVTQADVGS